MKWIFNQRCQLIVSEFYEKESDRNVIYILTKDSELIDYAINPESWVITLDSDGLYTILVLGTNKSEDEILNELKKGWLSFKKEIESPTDSSWDQIDKVDAFSICHLRQCVFDLEKQSIKEFLYECGKTKSTNRAIRDILLITLFVLENLICMNKYSEAESILWQISSCSDICYNIKCKTCNCHE